MRSCCTPPRASHSPEMMAVDFAVRPGLFDYNESESMERHTIHERESVALTKCRSWSCARPSDFEAPTWEIKGTYGSNGGSVECYSATSGPDVLAAPFYFEQHIDAEEEYHCCDREYWRDGSVPTDTGFTQQPEQSQEAEADEEPQPMHIAFDLTENEQMCGGSMHTMTLQIPRESSHYWQTPQANRCKAAAAAATASEASITGFNNAVATVMCTPQVTSSLLALRSSLDYELNETNVAHRPYPLPPVTELIDGRLYIGGLPDEETLPILRDLNVRHIINCCSQDYATDPAVGAEFVVHDIETYDQQDYLILHNDYDAFAQLVTSIMGRGENVFVHCIAGINRSVTLCAAFLMETNVCAPVDVVRLFRKKGRMRILENPGFRLQLVDHYLQVVCPRASDEDLGDCWGQ